MDRKKGFERTQKGCHVWLGQGEKLEIEAFNHGFLVQVDKGIWRDKGTKRHLSVLFTWDRVGELTQAMRMAYDVMIAAVTFDDSGRVSCRYRHYEHHGDDYWFAYHSPIRLEFLGDDFQMDRGTYVAGDIESFLHEAMASIVMDA